MIVLALAAAYFGGFVFLAFWGLAAIGVAWEWQRLIGGPRLPLRVAASVLALVAAAPWALYAHARLSLVMLLAGAVAAGAVADRDRRLAAGAGVVYAGAAMLAPALLPRDFVARRAALRPLFPRGLDFIFVADARAAALPRTTSIEA